MVCSLLLPRPQQLLSKLFCHFKCGTEKVARQHAGAALAAQESCVFQR